MPKCFKCSEVCPVKSEVRIQPTMKMPIQGVSGVSFCFFDHKKIFEDPSCGSQRHLEVFYNFLMSSPSFVILFYCVNLKAIDFCDIHTISR